jgi:hypothetical protein
MTRLRFLRSAALVLLLAACAGDSPTEPQVEGRMTGTLDGAPWTGGAWAVLHKGSLSVGSMRNRAEHHVILEVPFTGPGRYTVEAGKGRYYETVGLDVLTYQAAATSGTLVVDTYDPASGEITGTMELTANGPRGATTFQNGEFEARVFVAP